ncbi:MAG: aminotransferase class I/II-fold pyridoxal phosphate-dependent enzyme [Dehalococcoidia bacterium]|nr:aminotransferase class I/II-fold pyridoxal phosphate-dependent enzyme [Dehalococcoidia bacterium]
MLDSYRVLDLTDGGALLCGQMLGDLGADVIAVEPPGGRDARRVSPFRTGHHDADNSLYWWSLNRNKRGITLAVESPEDRERLRELAKEADFLVESYEPGYLAERGLGYSDLAAINPRLVMVSITPFGQEGPRAHWASSDLTAYASSCTLIMYGDDDRPPVAVSIPQAFLHAGAEAAVGALLAHTGRERDGLGQHVDVSAQTATMMATQAVVLSTAWGDSETKRMAGGVNFGGIPLKFINPASDGYVSVTFLFGSAIGPFTRRLMEVMFEEGIVDEATRDKDWINYTNLLLSGEEPLSELFRCMGLIEEFTKRHTKDDLFAMAQERGLLIVPVSTIDEVANSEQLAARDFWRELEHPELGTKVTYPGPFVKAGKPLEYRRRPPLLGEHNDEVSPQSQRQSAPPAATNGDRRLPLEGVKVLDFMWVVAGPWGTRYLADYGATVIKVDSSSHVDTARTIAPFKDHQPGPERSACYATVNAGKLGMTLNLADPEGQKIALELAKWADVITDSFSPGAMAKFGLGYDDIKKVNPGVIMLSSCLNGQTGPQAKLAGFGTMGLHLAGFGDLAGWPDRAPAGPAGAYTDYIAPKFTAAAILAALDHRRRTGEGQYIDLSQAEASQQFLAPALLDYYVNGNVQSRRGNASPDYAPHGVYPVQGEDRWVAIAALDDDQWKGLCRAIGRDDWASDTALSSSRVAWPVQRSSTKGWPPGLPDATCRISNRPCRPRECRVTGSSRRRRLSTIPSSRPGATLSTSSTPRSGPCPLSPRVCASRRHPRTSGRRAPPSASTTNRSSATSSASMTNNSPKPSPPAPSNSAPRRGLSALWRGGRGGAGPSALCPALRSRTILTMSSPAPSRRVARRTHVFTESVIREMTRQAGIHGALNLAQGFPDFSAPEFIKQAALDAINADINQYAITWGSPRLRNAIAGKVQRFYGLDVDPDAEVTVTCGATEAMMCTMLALFEEGDEVIIFEPFYENYVPDSAMTGATPVYVTMEPPDFNFDPDQLRAAFGPKTRAIILNSPSNPCGKVFTREELQQVADLCQEFDVLCITDEIYEHIIFGDHNHIPMATIPGMYDRTVTISGMSKTFSVTGWRIGYIVAPPWLTDALRKVHDFLTVGAPAPLQEAAAVAIETGDGYYPELRDMYARKRDILSTPLREAGFTAHDPDGAYYIMADFSDLGFKGDDTEFAMYLCRDIGVATVPGSSFFATPGEGNTIVRLTFSKSDETLQGAAERIGRM